MLIIAVAAFNAMAAVVAILPKPSVAVPTSGTALITAGNALAAVDATTFVAVEVRALADPATTVLIAADADALAALAAKPGNSFNAAPLAAAITSTTIFGSVFTIELEKSIGLWN